ncbi:MAG: DUF2057 family protein [Planctomycetota bacterium]
MTRVMAVALWLVSGSVLLLAGCASDEPYRAYEGPPRSLDEVAVLLVPVSVQVDQVDGQPFAGGGGLLGDPKSELHFLPGPHDLKVRYHVLWPIRYDEHEKVVSEVVTLRFEAAAGGRYAIAFEQPAELKDARRFAKSPVFRVEVSDSLVKGPGLPAATVPAAETPADAPPVVTEAPAGRPAAPVPETPAPEVRVLEALKLLWEGASEAERRSFREWIEKVSPAVPGESAGGS